MRAWRALLLLDVVKRLLHGGPEQRLARLEKLIEQKKQELAELRAEQAFLQHQITPMTATPDDPLENVA